jgi:hypothetical protein
VEEIRDGFDKIKEKVKVNKRLGRYVKKSEGENKLGRRYENV